MSVAYSEYLPAADLSNIVDRYWSMTSSDSARSIPEQLVSVNPGVELFFNLGAPYRRRDIPTIDEAGQEVRGSHLVGFRVRPVMVSQHGQIRVFAIRCKPEGLSAILPFRLGDAIHQVVPIDELWGAVGVELEDALFEAADDASRIRTVENCLRRLLKCSKENRLDRTLFSTLRSAGGTMTIRRLGAETGADYKRIERSFAKILGVSPKFYARVLRYQKAAEGLLRTPEAYSWLDAGYSDQAHFIREFSAFTGLSPARFIKGAQDIARWLLE